VGVGFHFEGPDRQQPTRMRAPKPVRHGAISFSASRGMVIAPHPRMKTAQDLIRKAEAYSSQRPERAEFARKLIHLVKKIDDEFAGEARERLLSDARTTFERHLKVVEDTERTLEALERLKKQQVQLIEGLARLAMFRPPGTLVH
jgi:phosphoenolpyruvate-protein kinase (PTS system EI component)